jgi:hypothetical protein
MPDNMLDATGEGLMRLKCVCGAEIYPANMEELRMYQQLPCNKTKNGLHNFKIWEREI